MLRLAVPLVFVAALAAAPVSYHRDIAPMLAMNCHTCHGANPDSAAASLSTRTWQDLMRGGKMGAVVIPGRPEQSALLQFVNGSRGEEHRMPLGGPPLSAPEIELIRRWIAEGALADEDRTTSYRLELPALAFPQSQPVRFFCRLPVPGYVELELTGPDGRTLHLDGKPVTTADWFHWDLRRAPNWPTSVRARLTVSHAVAEPLNAVFATSRDFPAGAAAIGVHSWLGEGVVFQGNDSLPAGLAGLAQNQWGNSYDFSVLKKVQITEGIRAQFRVEAFNVLNTPIFSANPDLTPTGVNFGRIFRDNGQSNAPRIVQLGFRLEF